MNVSRWIWRSQIWSQHGVRNIQGVCQSRTFLPESVARYLHLLQSYSPSDQLITVTEARNELKNIVGSPKQWGEERDPSVVNIQLPRSQSELTAKRMLDSYREAVIPLGSDTALRNKYINQFKLVRYGRIMEDLDTMAVLMGYTHNQDVTLGADFKSPLSIVTALHCMWCLTLDIHAGGLIPNADIIIRGHVTWAGSTSMEVTMEVDQKQNGSLHTAIDAKFLMVARNPENKSKAFVSPLLVETDEEKKLFSEGEISKAQRQEEAKRSLLKTPPSNEERLLIHELFLKTVDERSATFKEPVKPEGSVWMEKCLLKNVIICFPEERNLYHKIFGGFLMRQAYELAWANACVYCQSRVRIVAVDDIIFRKPVEIGSLLYLSSQVVYTEGSDLQIKVHAEVVDPTRGTRESTNTFHYTFSSPEGGVLTVMPKTYAEYMMYVDGKRHYEARSPKPR